MTRQIVNIKLDPAAVLYRKKLLLRSRAGISSKAVELPSIKYTIQKKKPDFNLRDTVKDWMRYLAYGCSALAKSFGQDLAFVALIRISSEKDPFTISMYCPYPQIFKPLRDSDALKHLAAEAGTPEIWHKYGLLEGLCPLVFQYSRASNEVLITNENHLTNPTQFLNTDYCKTTSGLLNFIGALSILEAENTSGTATHYQAAEAWMKSAMNSKRDEWLRWFYHLADRTVFFEPDRILVEPNHPETYYYNYSG